MEETRGAGWLYSKFMTEIHLPNCNYTSIIPVDLPESMGTAGQRRDIFEVNLAKLYMYIHTRARARATFLLQSRRTLWKIKGSGVIRWPSTSSPDIFFESSKRELYELIVLAREAR